MLRKAALFFFGIRIVLAQAGCDLPIQDIPAAGPTIFSQEQDGFLGDFFDELTRRSTAVYPQPALTDPLDAIANRLLKQLPPNQYKFRFAIVEIPSANAYAMAGGRIYISRLLIASLKNEDELAGIIAHEMGHVLARQSSAEFSKLLREVLKVTQLKDRADLYAKMNALLDAPARKVKNKQEEDQLEADRISLLATWRAGYDPEAYPRAFDRIFANHGARGNFFTDILGRTGADSKRYREMLKATQTMPATCRAPRDTRSEEAFETWRRKVADLAPEDLLLTLSTRQAAGKLVPALRPDLNNLRFSPDGRLLLAQDDSGIFVLQREPLKVLYRIPALGANDAIFHRDSQHILFLSGTGRIEMWDIAANSRARRWDLPLDLDCSDVLISPNAQTAACTAGYGSSVTLLELDSGANLAQHTSPSDFFGLLEAVLLNKPLATIAYTPDGIHLLQSARGAFGAWAFNVAQRKEVSIRGLQGALNGSFAFLDSGRVAIVAGRSGRSGLYTFPEGKKISEFDIPNTFLAPITKGEVLLLKPLGGYAAALMSIEERQIFQGSTKAAIDRYEDLGVSERNTGELALYRGKSTQPSAVLQLPDGDLNRLRSGAHSPDFQWLALSAGSRGHIWNLAGRGSSITPAFDGGTISAQGLWNVTFEERTTPSGKQGTLEKYRVEFDLTAGGEPRSRVQIERKEGERYLFSGRHEVRLVSSEKKEKPLLEVRDNASGKLQWSKFFELMPRVHLGSVGDAIVLELDSASKEAKDILKRHPAASKSDGRAVLQIFSLATGTPIGEVVTEIGGDIRSATFVGRTLFLQDTNNRTLSYSVETGERNGQQFGRILAVDAQRGRLAASNRLGSVAVLNDALRVVASFEYPRNVIYAGFDGEGKRLLVVTGSQEVFIETLPD